MFYSALWPNVGPLDGGKSGARLVSNLVQAIQLHVAVLVLLLLSELLF